jgi:para-aminobenzoate synthetase/4-amino-4-deoxychorismate lyase
MTTSLILKNDRENSWLQFSEPVEVISTLALDEVVSLFRQIETKVNGGLYAAGYLSYEAAPAFDSALKTQQASGFPLLHFGLYKSPRVIQLPAATTGMVGHPDDWLPPPDPQQYTDQVARIKQHIEAGNTYQVNYTFLQETFFKSDPWALFLNFAADAPYAAYVDMEDYAICSASPELFFELNEGKIVTRPMKGTAHRGRTLAEDLDLKSELSLSTKDRAENVMIVDMIRNDLGKIAVPGSIRVDDPFLIEKYPTVWQMTSSVTADSNASISEMMQALFPSASITGAPKVNTMKIISSLESAPRNVYTGCIGFMGPNGRAQFNVAIRTALIDKENQRLEYRVGSGIVWDSVAEKEYEECLLKAKVIQQPQFSSDFSLLETCLWTTDGGFFLLDYHLRRLCESATYFDINFDPNDLIMSLNNLARDFDHVNRRIRILLDRHGEHVTSIKKLVADGSVQPRKVALARKAINSNDVFLYHKTTRRDLYEQAAADFPDHDDVLLWNENGEVTESTIANLVIRRQQKLVTPPISCGLLAGTFRQHLLDTGQLEEGIVTVDEIKHCPEIYLVNSVRKWERVSLRID